MALTLPHGSIPFSNLPGANLQTSMMYVNENIAAIKTAIAELEEMVSTLQDGAYAEVDHDHDEDYAALEHTHETSDISGLEEELAGKADADHTHSGYLTSIPTHTHTEAQVDGLMSELNGKADTAHIHAISDVSGLGTQLDAKVGSDYVNQSISEATSKDALEPTIKEVIDDYGKGGTVKKVNDQSPDEDGEVTISASDIKNGSTNTVADDITSVKDDITDHETRISTVEGEVDAIPSTYATVSEVNTALSQARTRITAVETAATNASNAASSASSAAASATTTANAAKTAVDAITTTISGVTKVPLTAIAGKTGNASSHTGDCFVTIADDGTLGHSQNKYYDLVMECGLPDSQSVSDGDCIVWDATNKTFKSGDGAPLTTEGLTASKFIAVNSDGDGIETPNDQPITADTSNLSDGSFVSWDATNGKLTTPDDQPITTDGLTGSKFIAANSDADGVETPTKQPICLDQETAGSGRWGRSVGSDGQPTTGGTSVVAITGWTVGATGNITFFCRTLSFDKYGMLTNVSAESNIGGFAYGGASSGGSSTGGTTN